MADDIHDGIDDDFSKWRKIVDILYEGGMNEDPRVRVACQWFMETSGDSSLLEDVLEENPGILAEARRNRMVDIKANNENPFYPEPIYDEIPDISGEVTIGEVNGLGEAVGLDPIDFTRGLFVCGEIGSGKSYPVLRMLDQILSVPVHERGYNVIVAQAVKRDADFLINRHDSLRVIDWADIRRSPLRVEEWDTHDAKINSFCDVYSSVNWLMLYGQPLFKNAVEICIKKHGDRTDFSRLFNFVDVSAKYIGLMGPEHRNVRDSLKFSLFSFRETGQVLNCHNGMSVSDFFTKEDIVLNVAEQSSDYIIATFLADLFKDIQRYYEKKPLVDRGLRTLIVIDECRRVFPHGEVHSKTGHNPNSPMINFVTTRRSSGIGLIAITQEPQSAPDWLTDNSAYVLSMPISGAGRDHVKRLLNLTDDQAGFMDKLPSFGTGIMRYRGFPRRFIVDIPDDLDDSGVDPLFVRQKMRGYIEALHQSLDQGVIPHEKDIVGKEKEEGKFDLKAEKKKATLRLDMVNMIEALGKNPFQSYTDLRSALRLSSVRMSDCVSSLLQKGYAVEVEAIGLKGKKSRYVVLTEESPEGFIVSPHIFKHTLYEFRVMEYLKVNGYRDVKREYFGDGQNQPSSIILNPDDGEERRILKRIDVFGVNGTTGKREGFEVTLSFSNILDNIHKCLEVFKVDDLHIVTEDKARQQEAMDIVSAKVPGYLIERITFNTINDFILSKSKAKRRK